MFSSLTGKTISDKEYDHVLDVWNKFEMKTMKDSHDFYLKCDIVMFGHLFEKFKNNILKNYRPYPSHYLSAPGLSWDAMLKKAKITFELITDSVICIYSLKKGIRGGISYNSKRYSKANNKYLKSYVPNKNGNISYT